MSDKQPRPIDRLDAAHAALEAAKAEYVEALAVLEADHELTGASQWRTDRITVSIGTRRHVDTARFTQWVQEHRPDEIEPTVRPSYRRAFIDSLQWQGGEAYDKDGALVDFAGTTEYLTVRAR